MHLLRSPLLAAAELAQLFDEDMQKPAYEVLLAPHGEGLLWFKRSPSGAEMRCEFDPHTGWGLRFKVGFLAGLPIDWLL